MIMIIESNLCISLYDAKHFNNFNKARCNLKLYHIYSESWTKCHTPHGRISQYVHEKMFLIETIHYYSIH